jgi:hypothetical protein
MGASFSATTEVFAQDVANGEATTIPWPGNLPACETLWHCSEWLWLGLSMKEWLHASRHKVEQDLIGSPRRALLSPAYHGQYGITLPLIRQFAFGTVSPRARWASFLPQPSGLYRGYWLLFGASRS